MRPVSPVLGNYVLPSTLYHPAVGEGDYSTGVFVATAGDSPVTIKGAGNAQGTWCVDAESYCEVTLPHWPEGVIPAAGGDGHAEVVDTTTGIIHSFWQLKRVNGSWTATQYAWSRLDGRGWGDPGHYYQGARAAGVPSMGGLIRKHEIEDGDTQYRHVLAMSLDNSAMRSGYVFPATSEDGDGPWSYAGQIPMGTLMMLPPGFDSSQLSTPALRKIANTLKTYGARIIDRNTQTRFNIYVENGSGFDLHRNGWNWAAANDLGAIADALRPVESTAGWLDGSGRSFVPTTKLNLISMRGQFNIEQGGQGSKYDSWKQAVVFPATASPIVQYQYGGSWAHLVRWAPWASGKTYRFTVSSTGGAKMRIQFKSNSDQSLWDSGYLSDGQVVEFVMPSYTSRPVLWAMSGTGTASAARATLIER